MKNPKTTVPGLFLVIGAGCYLIGHALGALFGAPDVAHAFPVVFASVVKDWPAVGLALAGLAAVGAQDGKA